jgi:Tfp pilus assembly protein PilO
VKGTDRTILFAVIGIAAVVAFYFLMVSPKRAEVGELDTKIEDARAAVAEQEQLAALAEEAKSEYRSDYQHLVVLGKAVPGDDDVSSLIEQVNSQATAAGIEFRALTLAAGTDGGTVEPPPAPTAEAPAGEVPAEGEAVPPTEAAVAVLPLGAAVGPAGLPTMPYDLTFSGEFFQIADFMAGLDGMVKVDDEGVGVDGRLLTIDGFSLTSPAGNFPHLTANLHVTSFVTPADQGLTAGATPAAPAESTPTATTPTTAPPVATSSAPTP